MKTIFHIYLTKSPSGSATHHHVLLYILFYHGVKWKQQFEKQFSIFQQKE